MRYLAIILPACLAIAGWGFFQDRDPQEARPQRPEGLDLVKTVSVAGNVPWTDTGIEVKTGEVFFFEATGTISLQKDNPVASCGPEGLKLRTMQQPLPDRNLGCLLGRIVMKVEVVEDKATGEKTTRDYGEVFFIGPAALVIMPLDGRLTLGTNENVSGDNDGSFAVSIYRRKA
jgi:hypothetical protein